ncbi:MAG TPA: caspase family protein [Pyrinomonadaceae bacterium]|nr:caspase family protein [Pyrinomonadaceae bacterium]
MKKIALSAVFLVLFSLGIKAQGLYKVAYQAGPIRYDAILVWYGSGQPFMRIAFYHPDLQKMVLAQQNVAYLGNAFSGTLIGSNPGFLTPMPAGYHYEADNFVFQRQQNGFFACTGMVSENLIYPVLEFRPLLQYEVTSALLQAYGFAAPTAASTSNPSRVTMYLIVVANLDDRDIGADIDVAGIVREFRFAANEIGITFNPTTITGDSFSRTNVVNTLNYLKPGSNDIVVFVYSGHGFRYDDDTDSWPRMAMTRNRQSVDGNSMSEAEIYDALKRKGARLNITLVDACNSRIGRLKPHYDAGVVLRPSDAGISRQAVQTLFLEARGNILMAAAQEGENALANKETGGFFIHSFLDALMYETSIANSGTPSWKTMISNAIEYTSQQTNGRQTAIYNAADLR